MKKASSLKTITRWTLSGDSIDASSASSPKCAIGMCECEHITSDRSSMMYSGAQVGVAAFVVNYLTEQG
jgi:hypothetical protein